MEHAVVLSLRIADGSEVGHERIAELARGLAATLDSVAGGEFGGLDARAGYCLLYCYGDDAGEVFEAIPPPISEFGPESGSWIIKRFGAATDRAARRERVDL